MGEVRILQDFGLCSDPLDLVKAEDSRQRNKWGFQRHSLPMWLTITAEEFGELAKAILDDDNDAIIKEAVQLSTLALKIAWMVKRDKDKTTPTKDK